MEQPLLPPPPDGISTRQLNYLLHQVSGVDHGRDDGLKALETIGNCVLKQRQHQQQDDDNDDDDHHHHHHQDRIMDYFLDKSGIPLVIGFLERHRDHTPSIIRSIEVLNIVTDGNKADRAIKCVFMCGGVFVWKEIVQYHLLEGRHNEEDEENTSNVSLQYLWSAIQTLTTRLNVIMLANNNNDDDDGDEIIGWSMHHERYVLEMASTTLRRGIDAPSSVGPSSPNNNSGSDTKKDDDVTLTDGMVRDIVKTLRNVDRTSEITDVSMYAECNIAELCLSYLRREHHGATASDGRTTDLLHDEDFIVDVMHVMRLSITGMNSGSGSGGGGAAENITTGTLDWEGLFEFCVDCMQRYPNTQAVYEYTLHFIEEASKGRQRRRRHGSLKVLAFCVESTTIPASLHKKAREMMKRLL
jgi:hypothetical protein